MKAYKFTDIAGNVFYIKSESLSAHSLIKASIGNNPYKGCITTMFFKDNTDLQTYLSKNPDKMIIGRGNQSPVKIGNSRNNKAYEIETAL